MEFRPEPSAASIASRTEMSKLLPEKPDRDEHGMAVVGHLHVDPAIYASFREACTYTAVNPQTTDMVRRLVDGPHDTTVMETKGTGIGHSLDPTNGNATVIWNPHVLAVDAEGRRHSGAVVLGHELDHADQATHDPKQFALDKNTPAGRFNNREEWRASVGWERTTSRLLGEPIRMSHDDGAFAPSRGGVTSTDFVLHQSRGGAKPQPLPAGYSQDGTIVEMTPERVTQSIRGRELVTYPANEFKAAMLPAHPREGENVRVEMRGGEPRAVELPAPQQQRQQQLDHSR